MFLKVDWTLGKRVLTLAYPVTIAMLTQTAINLVDTIMVGRLPSAWSIAGQSAIAISLILLWAVGGLISSIAVGTQALAARRVGAEDCTGAGGVLNNAVTVGAVLSLIATVGVLWALPDLFSLLHGNPAVVEFGVDYCTYRFLGIISMVLTIIYKGFFDGIGQTKVHMKAAILMNVVNVILNYCLIFGIGPFPQMYVSGAGLASLIATFVGLAVMIFFSARREERLKFGLYRKASLNWRVTRDVVRIGIPGGVASLFVMTGFGIFITIVGWLDERTMTESVQKLPEYTDLTFRIFGESPTVWDAHLHETVLSANPPIFTAASKVIMDIMSVIFMSCMAFGQATATLVGQSLGADKPDLAERYGWVSVKLGAYFMLVFGLGIVLFPDAISGVFNPSPSVIDAAHSALMLMGGGAAFIAISMILLQSLFGAGMTVYVMVVEMVLHFFCLIPLAYLFGLALDWGLLGIWGAALTYIVLLAAAMVWKFHGGDWKQHRI